ncbi:hypothetical protein C8Q76DRAFT_806576 [Earliella scabrosa]|nr:hypothetical protein C8Q76DRAFT_806576 [Earliella scabrosa]
MPPPQAEPRCWRCGASDHTTKACHFPSKVCFNCHVPGHTASACPISWGVRNWTCGGCRRKGHTTDDCDHREASPCPICKTHGHPVRSCPSRKNGKKKKPAQQHANVCAKCGQAGHTPVACLPSVCAVRESLLFPAYIALQQRVLQDCGGVGVHNAYCFTSAGVADETDETSSTRSSTPTIDAEPPYQEPSDEEVIQSAVEQEPRCSECGSQEHTST